MKQVRIGLIGTGYIGRCHAIAYAQAPTVFPLDAELVLEYLAEITPELAEKKAKEFGFKSFYGRLEGYCARSKCGCSRYLHSKLSS